MLITRHTVVFLSSTAQPRHGNGHKGELAMTPSRHTLQEV
jgi:hypothetical protein